MPTPVAQYSFDTDFADPAGANALSSTGSAAIASGGQTGSALGKTGATMPVLPAGVLSACQSDDRTIMFDAKGALTTWWVRFEKDAIGSGVWGILLISGSMAVQARRASDDSLATRPTATAPDSSGWHNYCATYSRATGVISLYRDGVLASTSSFAAGTQLTVNADRINIAEWSTPGAAMDNLRLYAVELTPSEVAATAGTPVTGGASATGAATGPQSTAAGTANATASASGAGTALASSGSGAAFALAWSVGSVSGPASTASGSAAATASATGSPATLPAAGTGSAEATASATGAVSAPAATAHGFDRAVVQARRPVLAIVGSTTALRVRLSDSSLQPRAGRMTLTVEGAA